MNEVERLLDQQYFHNTVWQWTVAAGVVVGVFLLTMLIRRIVRGRYARLAATPETELMELPLKVASHTSLLFLIVVSLYAGLAVLTLPPKP
ncbi:MAG TPA: hypothetical protein VKB34_10565, partial [Povalibacter sp.]|nr:hypothetical protein [Povalibacter sp.]